MADIMVRRENVGSLTEGCLYKVMPGITQDYLILQESPITIVDGQVNINAPVLLPTVPTEDPLVAGALWSNLGVLTVSAGA